MSAEDDDRLARVALTWLVEPGHRTVWELVQQQGAAATLAEILAGRFATPSLGNLVAARAGKGDPVRMAELALRHTRRLGARVVVPGDQEWPGRVESLATLEFGRRDRVHRDVRPPLCIWVRGEHPLGAALERSVSVVGARAATSYGLHVTMDIAFGLAEQGWTVVSGGAMGIDATAHRAALGAGGLTIAVLACGVDRPYPVSNTALFEQIAETGLLMSEWPPGSDPLRHRFLIRNRVIAAATAGTVLVEAAARSGAVQTMGRVLALNRPALVVPGPVTSAMSVGCHELLRTCPGTRVVTNAAQVLDEVGRIGEYYAEPARALSHARDELDEESALVLEAVPDHGTAGPEELAARAGVRLRTVLQRLTLLEIKGLVVRRDNGFALTRAARASVSRTAPLPSNAPSPPAAIPSPAALFSVPELSVGTQKSPPDRKELPAAPEEQG
ncbi:DNA-processing protein DprA [Actinoplanes sp. RD1]|uniref:DNA-processing protein DprA n=1 Tax=Actinoplanes sp. RD1 TaxID=3064538 RepID=UPI002740AC56|nr:DNA-processing protein DprA [Actinoplanes sp. RD1]